MLKRFKSQLIKSHLFPFSLLNVNSVSKHTKSSRHRSRMNSVIFRQWNSNPYYHNYQPQNNEAQLTVMSYNILAQDLIDKHPYLYYNSSSDHLKYETRTNNILLDIRGVRPDILCLQEMQENHLDNFKQNFKSIDLQGCIYKKRTSDDQTDGCAIFFNSNVMEVIQEEKVEYFQPNVNLLNRTNVGIIAKFRLKQHVNSVLVVATTHLLYNPRRQDVRLAQLQVILAEIDRVAFMGYNELQQPQYVPVILTGDFNFTPSSAPHALIVNGALQYNNLNKQLELCNEHSEPSFGNELLPPHLGIADNCRHYKSMIENDRSTTLLHNSEIESNGLSSSILREIQNSHLPFGSGLISHKFNFVSVYDADNSVSTYQNQWLLVDYMFYGRKLNPHTNESNLKLLSRLSLPTFEYCHYIFPYGGLPNLYQGSDHISLAAKFLLSSS